MRKLSLLIAQFILLVTIGYTQSVTIGTQVWMTKNLDVDTFQNGDPIPHAKTWEEWKRAGENKQPAWGYYNNDSIYGKKCGKLYNWYAVNDLRGLAPMGWKIPDITDFKILLSFIGVNDGGKKLKSTTDWTKVHYSERAADKTYRKNGDNRYGFNCIHCGSATGGYGYAVFWSKTSLDEWNSDILFISGLSNSIQTWDDMQYDGHGADLFIKKENGYSVRCIKD